MLAAGALALGPRHRLVGGVVDEVGAGGHLDAVTAGLVHIQEHPLGDRVLGRRHLDRHVGIQEQVSGAKELLARIDEPREVVQPGGRGRSSGVIGDVDQLVGRDRQAHPCARLLAAIEDHLLIQAEPQLLGREPAVGGDIGGEHVDVIDPLGPLPPGRRGAGARCAAADADARAARSGPARRTVRTDGRRIPELVGGAVAVIAVTPAVAEADRLDALDPSLQRLGAPRPDRDWPSPGSLASVSLRP